MKAEKTRLQFVAINDSGNAHTNAHLDALRHTARKFPERSPWKAKSMIVTAIASSLREAQSGRVAWKDSRSTWSSSRRGFLRAGRRPFRALVRARGKWFLWRRAKRTWIAL